MRKYLLLVGLIVSISEFLIAQRTAAIIADSLRIDSLVKVVPTLKGREKVDGLNILFRDYRAYTGPGGGWFDGKNSDRLFEYKANLASEAYKEAIQIGYKFGEAKALINLAMVECVKNNLEAAKKNFQLAMDIGKEINSDWIIGISHFEMGNFILLWSGIDRDEIKKNPGEVLAHYIEAIKYFRKSGDENMEATITTWTCEALIDAGKYDEAINYCQRCFTLSQKRNDPMQVWANWRAQYTSWLMASLHKKAGDYESAIEYLRNGFQFTKTNKLKWDILAEMGENYYLLNQYDSALYYLQESLKSSDTTAMWGKTRQGRIYLLKKDYNKAYIKFSESLKITDPKNHFYSWMNNHYGAMALAGMKKYNEALQLEKKAVSIMHSNIKDDWEKKIASYNSLAEIFYNTGNKDSAFIYLKKLTMLKDTMHQRQFNWKLENLKAKNENEQKETQLSLLSKDNKIKEQRLKQESQLKYFFILGFIGLLVIALFIFRGSILKRKKEKAEHEKKQTDLEMQALRAQMNPHFIFNCLSSINKYILKNEPDTASDYLTRFSRLMRMVLLNSQKSLITLEDELEMLTIYLDMERMRFKNTFNYNIIFSNRVDTGAIFIPPLLLQPFCENAIWHGLKHLADQQQNLHDPGKLDIVLSMEDKVLNCSITDNGIGRQKAAEIKSKSAEGNKSMGLKITTERLALLNQEKNAFTSYEIEDLKDEQENAIGTKVNLRISYKETVEESV